LPFLTIAVIIVIEHLPCDIPCFTPWISYWCLRVKALSFNSFNLSKSLSLFALSIWVDVNYDGSKAVRILIPKIHINGKTNIRIEKNVKN